MHATIPYYPIHCLSIELNGRSVACGTRNQPSPTIVAANSNSTYHTPSHHQARKCIMHTYLNVYANTDTRTHTQTCLSSNDIKTILLSSRLDHLWSFIFDHRERVTLIPYHRFVPQYIHQHYTFMSCRQIHK